MLSFALSVVITALPSALASAVPAVVPPLSVPPSAPSAPSTPAPPPAPAPGPAASSVAVPVVDLAICLDTSGSMNGLLDAARGRLWDIVNELALAKPTPKLRVALLTFGNNGHTTESGWVKVDIGFTEDLDEVSRQLFALTTNGGEEYVGRVLASAAEQLAWTPANGSPTAGGATATPLQMVVVAGNESADQDRTVSFRDACRTLIGRGIVVNSIYCGNPSDELAPAWREVATLSDGQFAAIDQSTGAMAIATPWDDELARLSAELNKTYLPYGLAGSQAWANQTEQDLNAHALNSATAAQRCVSKSGDLYDNTRWDLVDASEKPEFKLESIKDEELPEAMRSMTIEQRKAFIAETKAARAGIKQNVAELGQKRQAFVDAEQKVAAEAGRSTFGNAMLGAIRAQGSSKGLVWKQ